MSEEPDGYTTIPVKPETQEKVRKLKRGGESYDELICKMIEQYDIEVEL